MNFLIVDIQYFGDYKYYLNLLSATYVTFEQYGNYDKRHFLNKCRVTGANGPILLSVPLKHGRNQKVILKDVIIWNEHDWQKAHWRTLVSCYSGSPWFSFYADSLASLYGRPFTFLLDWNLACLNWSLENLKIKFEYRLTEDFKTQYPDDADGRKSAQRAIVQTTDEPFRYKQVFEHKTGFISGLSILDLLFCEGPVFTVERLSGR